MVDASKIRSEKYTSCITYMHTVVYAVLSIEQTVLHKR